MYKYLENIFNPILNYPAVWLYLTFERKVRPKKKKKEVKRGIVSSWTDNQKPALHWLNFLKLSLAHASAINPSVYKHCLIPMNLFKKKKKVSLSC